MTAPTKPATKTIQIITDPPGARIDVDEDYVGDELLSNGGNFTKVSIIRTTPMQQGLFVKSKYFSYDSPVPSRILFSMGLAPVRQYQLRRP